MSSNNENKLNVSSERDMFGRNLSLHDFVTIFKTKKNPLSNPIEEEKWIRHIYECSLMSEERFEKVKAIAMFGQHFFPFCNSEEKYEQVFKMMIQFFVIDDHGELTGVGGDLVRGKFIWAQMEKALDKLINEEFISMSGWRPYTMMTYAIHQTICNEYNPFQKKRFIDLFRQYYKSNVVENSLCKSGGMATESPEYLIEVRKGVSGCYPTFALIEYSESITVTEEEWEDPLMQKYMDLAAKSIFFWNDLYSFEKELYEYNNQIECVLNVVAITSLSQNLSIEDSITKVTEQLRIIEKECQDVSIQLVSDPKCSEMKKIFIDRIKYTIGANYLGITSNRYKHSIV